MSQDAPTQSANSTTFEDSLSQLQQIVQDLEEGKCGLEESLAKFERGIRLLRDCHQRLALVEQKIDLLTGWDGSGNPITSPFDAASTMEQQRAAETAKPARKRGTPKKGGSAAPATDTSAEATGEDADGRLPF